MSYNNGMTNIKLLQDKLKAALNVQAVADASKNKAVQRIAKATKPVSRRTLDRIIHGQTINIRLETYNTIVAALDKVKSAK